MSSLAKDVTYTQNETYLSSYIWCLIEYRENSNINRTKYQNWNVSRLVFQLSLPNPLKPAVKSSNSNYLIRVLPLCFSDIPYFFPVVFISVWNWSNTMNTWPALWLPMSWCFSARTSVAKVFMLWDCMVRKTWFVCWYLRKVVCSRYSTDKPLQWRHNERDGVSNHRCLGYFLNRLFRRRSKKTSKFRVTGLCEGNSPVTSEFPESIPKVNESPLSYMGNRLIESIYLEPVTENEINTLIKALKDTATGFDNMDSMSLKISSETLIKPLTHVCNLSLTQGIFPQSIENCKCHPLVQRWWSSVV